MGSKSSPRNSGLLNHRKELITVFLLIVDYSAIVLTVARRDVLTPWLTLPFLALFTGWQMSLQHELIHGHPFRSRWINDLIGSLPFTLWIPYNLYRQSHLEHHELELTAPGVDTESYYVTEEQWTKFGAVHRAYLWANRTIVFRLLVWTVVSTTLFLLKTLRDAVRGVRGVRTAVVLHLVGVAFVLWLFVGVMGIQWWYYALGAVYGGRIVSAIRPFPEHLYQPGTELRTAMIMSGPFMSLLMLNNNLHIAHHEVPGAPWYEMPAVTQRINAVERARAAGLLYEGGYAEVFRRFSFKPMGTPLREGV